MVTKDDFRRAMSKFATGVTVVTTLDNNGEVHGMTANAFTSVCLEPAVLLVCVSHNARTCGYVEARGTFGVNILGTGQQSIGQYFAKRPEDRHEDVEVPSSTTADGVPLLDGSLVSFSCRVVGSHIYGDHTIYVAAVEQMTVATHEDPLLFYDSHWNTSISSGDT